MALGAGGCGASQAKVSGPGVHTDAATASLFARESSASLAPAPFTVLEGAIKGTVDAVGAPSVKTEKNPAGEIVSVVEFSIGAELPASCTFRESRMDSGSVMQELVSHIATPDMLAGKEFAPEVSVAVGDGNAGTPILTVVSPFVEDGKQGLAKISVAPHDGGTVICTHFEPGYKATFAKIVSRLVGSLAYAKSTPTSKWHEVQFLEKDGMVAFEELDLWDAKKPGQAVARKIFGSFAQLQGHWFGADGMSARTYEVKGGAIIEDTTTFAVAGNVFSKLKLTRKQPGTYAVEGKRGDDAVDVTFPSKTPITDETSRAKQIKEWLRGKAPEAHFVAYDDQENLKAPTDVVYKRTGDDPAKVTIETHGAKPSTTTCTLDANGFCERSGDPSDSSRKTRLFVRGAP
jgi:hypothetical protein